MGYIAGNAGYFDTIAELKNQVGSEGIQAEVAYAAVPGDRGGGKYRWSETSTAANDNMNIVQVTGVTTGRWVRMQNNNYSTGTTSVTLSLTPKTYDLPHGLSFIPSAVVLQPTNAAAASGAYYVSGISATNIQITYNTIGIIGTANFSYVAFR